MAGWETSWEEEAEPCEEGPHPLEEVPCPPHMEVVLRIVDGIEEGEGEEAGVM